MKEGAADRLENEAERLFALAADRSIVSCRQAVEWGMQAIQGPFSRVTQPLPNNHAARKRILDCVFRLYQVRVRVVGLNQIRTVYEDGLFDVYNIH